MPTPRQYANAIRFLSMDAVQKAKSGHPGMPMGMADIAEVLWREHIKVNPKNPQWPNRDRFVLSNGHGSMLLYSVLHLTGFDVSMDDLKAFRSLHSKTPGHPEHGETPGVETTTGPLGQGLANAVGFAMAESMMAATFNKDGFPVVDHKTYVFVGDGCLMEGISHEAASLAGTLKLRNLIVLWDDNGISIDGEIAGWCADDVPGRFKSYGWKVIAGVDGHSHDAVNKALAEAQGSDAPVLICCRTVIGYGAPESLVGTEKTHGAPLGDENIAKTRQSLEWDHIPFHVPRDIKEGWDLTKKGQSYEEQWNRMMQEYAVAHPALYKEWVRRLEGKAPAGLEEKIAALIQDTLEKSPGLATRSASHLFLETVAPLLPELVGGSADLTGSNLTHWSQAPIYSPNQPAGQYVYYGVREFGMAGIMNGLVLYGGLRPFGGTFLTFLDYMRNGVRMAALMKQPSIFVFTHDSIGLGEDGPTHQPIEHFAMLRATPNMLSWRPADTLETVVGWKVALEHKTGPTCLILSRQGCPAVAGQAHVALIEKGAYVLYEPQQAPRAIVIATGSEVKMALDAAKALGDAHPVRVVSMPSMERFVQQSKAYQEEVLPSAIQARVAVEAACSFSWHRFVGPQGKILGIDTFGVSSPANEAYKYFGLTVEAVKAALLEVGA